ncbi:hypothetical protein SHM_26130 [Spiroplasma ixodetis]|uniref:ISXO2-like transposase domain-containing protein n=1 Tax=Spiroplasma ixodetis TaxID=2141 RepID=A0ABN6T6R5_9MOLU|nr:hypothetical protein SHM_26130 [Spiroplasma ixodetis]
MIFSLKKKYQISYLCWLLNVSKSGYYKWIKNGMNEFNKWDTFLANIIKNIFYEFQEIYGYKMITLWINKIYNLKLKFHIVYRYMKNMSLKAKVRIKKFDYRTKSGSLRYDNLLKRDFSTTNLNEKLGTDITYLLTNGKTYYLSIVKDFHNNETDFSPHVLVEGIMKLNEFNNAFQTEQQCLAYIANLKENKCIRCFSFNLNTSDLKRMRCLKCNQTFSILTGTIFSRSQTSLTSWFYLIFRWINTKHGIPSTDIAKELGVTLKTAWRMTHKIRTRIAKQKPQFIVEGTVQIDEMYLSHMGFKKQGRSLVNKTLIVGIYQKTTNNLIVKVLKNAKSKNLLQFAKNHISSKCLVYTDSWKGYCDFKSVFTKHETVNHQDGYVSKIGVNTNQIESVWKHIRRTFKTHIKVAKHHVHLYAKEAAYKFNKIPSFETVMLCLI